MCDSSTPNKKGENIFFIAPSHKNRSIPLRYASVFLWRRSRDLAYLAPSFAKQTAAQIIKSSRIWELAHKDDCRRLLPWRLVCDEHSAKHQGRALAPSGSIVQIFFATMRLRVQTECVENAIFSSAGGKPPPYNAVQKEYVKNTLFYGQSRKGVPTGWANAYSVCRNLSNFSFYSTQTSSKLSSPQFYTRGLRFLFFYDILSL